MTIKWAKKRQHAMTDRDLAASSKTTSSSMTTHTAAPSIVICQQQGTGHGTTAQNAALIVAMVITVNGN